MELRSFDVVAIVNSSTPIFFFFSGETTTLFLSFHRGFCTVHFVSLASCSCEPCSMHVSMHTIVGTSVLTFVGRFVGDMFDIGSIFISSNDQKIH